jgi:carbon-monoxide dehydrogenase medium subunit
MVTEIRVPKYSGPAGGSYLKLERKIGDYATVGVATHLVLDGAGRISEAGIGLTAVAGINLKAVEAERVLVGQEPSAALFAEAADVAARSCEPDSDVRGPADYKRAVVAEYTRRGLAAAHQQATGRN